MKAEHKKFIESKRAFVPPSGPKESCKIACVGEQPGRQEVFKRRPFVGPAGQNLDSCLQDARMVRSEIYFTNAIKDLDHSIKHYIDIPPRLDQPVEVSKEGEIYLQILKEELEECSANIILAFGNIAMYGLTLRRGITSWRGSLIESTLIPGKKVLLAIHPATYTDEKLRINPSAYLNKHLITMDLKKAKDESKFPEIRKIPRAIKIKPTFRDAISWLDFCRNKGLHGHTIDYDIELSNDELSCISFAVGPFVVMSIPFTGPGGDYFPPDQEAEIMLVIATILKDEKIRKRGQYIIFDSHFLLHKYGIRSANLDDTMIAQKILYPDFLVGLDFITAMYTDLPYYKKDGKFWLKGIGTFEQGWQYNALDSIACADAFPKQREDLEHQGNVGTYERQKKLIAPLTYMMERGIKVDVEGMKKDAEEREAKIEILMGKLTDKVGRDLNPNSPKQLIQYFYVEKGLPTYRKKGKATTEETALKRISRKGYEEASIILEIRGLVKSKSTYLDIKKVDPDGRIRASWNPVGTRYSRISSGENIFGTGTNLQNWPHDVRRHLKADEGYVFYELDLSQIENRIVAYVGNIPQMIEAFESDQDVHALTAALIFNKHPDEISDEEGSSSLAGGKYSERFWGKKSNHAFNYDLGYKNFSLKVELPERDGKWIHSKYHASYPGVRNNYQAMVKSQLAKNRTLTNLMERRTVFLGQWGDKLFKEAYSCIPQGTCGDIINERGLEYIYYNQDMFAPIELLTQLHDSVGFQIPLSVPLIRHAQMLIKIKQSLEQPLEYKGRSFIVPVDLAIGFNMFKKEGVEIKAKQFSEHAAILAGLLAEAISKLKR